MTSLYAYAYEIVPPLPSRAVGAMRALLEKESAVAPTAARKWIGRLVLHEDATHVLIVSEALGRDFAINLRLEAELLRLGATFSLTAPMAVTAPPTRSTKRVASAEPRNVRLESQ